MGPPTTVSSSTLAWEAALSTHPDSRFANYIRRALLLGLGSGFTLPGWTYGPAVATILQHTTILRCYTRPSKLRYTLGD